MEINEDGTLSLPAQRVDAHALDELLRQLAKARAQMSPAVARRVGGSERILLVETDPTIEVGAGAEGFITIGLRHQGFGWLHFRLPSDKAAAVQRFIAKRIAATGQEVGIPDIDLPGGDFSKH